MNVRRSSSTSMGVLTGERDELLRDPDLQGLAVLRRNDVTHLCARDRISLFRHYPFFELLLKKAYSISVRPHFYVPNFTLKEPRSNSLLNEVTILYHYRSLKSIVHPCSIFLISAKRPSALMSWAASIPNSPTFVRRRSDM